MHITFCGAARTVTGSQHLLEVNGRRILLDCGLYQGPRAESRERNSTFVFDPASVDTVILSHAHIDHSGCLPSLVKRGFEGPIISTHATRSLCASMLLDSGNIQERDADFLNKKRAKRDEPPIEPIYTQDDAGETMTRFSTLTYSRSQTVAPGVTLTFKDAGHMLGSAFVILDIEDQDARRDLRLVFSGDVGRKGIPIIRDPDPLDSADVLIVESTYGDRLHPPYADDAERMKTLILETYQRGGVVLIPAFAVGRTQQVVYQLHQMMRRGDIPQIPIVVDSPLAADVTAAYRAHPECYDAEMRAFVTSESLTDAFGFDQLRYTRTVDESKQLNDAKSPMVIIAPSGMMEHGRILHHLRNRVEDPRTTVLVVGFQAENTLGRRLIDGAPEVRIFGETYHPQAEVVTLEGFSGHADRDELSAWIGGATRGADAHPKPARTFLVHGELPVMSAFAATLRERHGLRVDVPEWKQRVEV